MRVVVLGLAIVVGLGGLWLWRELRATDEHAATGARMPTTASTRDATTPSSLDAPRVSSPDGVLAPGELPPPLGGVRAWSTAPAPADGPDPFAPVPQLRTEADTRAGLAP